MEHVGAVFKLDLMEKNKDAIAREGGNCPLLPHIHPARRLGRLN